MSANAIANVEVLIILAVMAVVGAAIAWPFVRWNKRLRRMGHQSPFVTVGLLVGYLSALVCGFIATSLRPGICWSCTPAGNPEQYQPALIWPHVVTFAIGFTAGTLVGVAITGVVVWLTPKGTRRSGRREARFPWQACGRASLVCLAFVAVFYWRGLLTGSGAYHMSQFLFGLWAGCAALARRSRSRPLEEVVAADPRPTVVYLRPFDREDAAFASVKTEDCREWGIPVANAFAYRQPATFEQYLGGSVTRQLGPFIALGDPNDYLPPEGAARAYLEDGNWKEAFEQMARASACLLLAVGRSENLQWELRSLRAWGLQHKLFVLTQPVNPWRWLRRFVGRRAAREWTAFAADLAACELEPGAYPGEGVTIGFDDRGRGCAIGTGARTPEQYVAAIEWSLRALKADAQSCA